MGHSEYDPGSKGKRPWNAGRLVGAKRGLKLQQVWAIRFWLNNEGRLRDRAMFDLAIDSKLRGCDVVKMKIGDLVSGGRVRSRAIVVQQKTGRPVQFELLEPARASILAWLECRGGTLDDFVFPSRINHNDHVSTRQYARLVDEWVTGIGLLRQDYGTHSLRRTKASIIYKQTGNLRAVQILLGHTKLESTVRYLGVDVEDALALAEGTEV
ncbi:MAG: integrase [Acidiphilium sp. 37-64-53]|uniref:Tyrosine-type recombinase/integrase n=1 Tax=Acidiphilium acidophilum TaxID=76588 RepID=A0AAW9DKV6_ACIAO|nr:MULTISPECIES: tyrosine-type recombinase/integrase [Acidiphilium]MDX5929224.1 tyrosine-type recombinase/integrase [Acidiphilium acidophilum]OYV99252.1 MAG: integrase [Acidiphilium sp. 37-64-53]HQT90022.1 tyrosine-type recombinase/integrase [Acidiphilium sp.]HQU25300.1 tyrosine-type recombinase/integrase [Acidiphilium sp.]